MASPSSSRFVVYAAFAGNLLIAVTKFVAAWWTGSSAMLSEAIHSLVDTGNQVLLLYGMHRAALPPDERHPLGYGRELYFWSFVVALLMFMLGAGVTFYEGVLHIVTPQPIVDPVVSYVVLACSAIFEGTTWFIALREFRKVKGSGTYYEELRRSKDPPAFIVLFEDSAALIGLLFAFIGTLASELLEMPVLDGVASIGISLVLAATAMLLARESKGLLLGEPADRPLRDAIVKIAQAAPGIERADIAFSVHLAPEQILVALSLEFDDRLNTTDIEQTVLNLERTIRDAHPEVVSIFVKPQTAHTFQWRRGHILGRAS